MEVLPAATTGDGVVLRCYRVDDAPVLAAAVTDSLEHLRPWMPWIAQEPMALADRRALIASWEVDRRAGGDAIYGMFQGDELVGGCGLHRRIGPHGLEIGYWVHVDHGGRGIATRASIALTDLAFTLDDIDHVEIHHDLANERSARVPAGIAGYVRQPDLPVVGDLAPAETGCRGVWRTTRAEWRAQRG